MDQDDDKGVEVARSRRFPQTSEVCTIGNSRSVRAAVAGAGPDHRVLRGGSFDNNQRNVRCAYRNRNNPHDINRNNGFRVAAVASTIFQRPELPGGALALPGRGVKNGGTGSWPRPEYGCIVRHSGRAHSNGPTPWAQSLAWGHRKN